MLAFFGNNDGAHSGSRTAVCVCKNHLGNASDAGLGLSSRDSDSTGEGQAH